jgi:DNA-binding NarL/FixJ family response regulator
MMPDDKKSPVHILLANLPAVVAELVMDVIGRQDGVEVTDQAHGDQEIMTAAAAVDLVIISVDQVMPPPGLCGDLLSMYPKLKILVLADHENTAMGYWLDVRRCRIRPIDGEKLVEGIRSLAERTLSI